MGDIYRPTDQISRRGSSRANSLEWCKAAAGHRLEFLGILAVPIGPRGIRAVGNLDP